MVLSSTYSPVLSPVGLDAQPALNAAKATAVENTASSAMDLGVMFMVTVWYAVDKSGSGLKPVDRTAPSPSQFIAIN
jgi:hypothetical protein